MTDGALHAPLSRLGNELGNELGTASVRRPGKLTGNHHPSCTAEQAKKFYTLTRQQKRATAFEWQMGFINRVAGGDPRRVRRAMARARAKAGKAV